MKLPTWLDEQEFKSNLEIRARVCHLIAMGADHNWPREWYRKISHSISPFRQPLVIELLTTSDDDMDHPEHFISMRNEFIKWLNTDQSVMDCPIDFDGWQLLRKYQDEMNDKINCVVDDNCI